MLQKIETLTLNWAAKQWVIVTVISTAYICTEACPDESDKEPRHGDCRSVWGPASVKPSQLVAVIERLMALDAQETCLDYGAWIFCPLLTNKIIKCSSILRTSKTIHANNKKLHEFTCTFNTLYTAKLDSPSTMLWKHVRLYAGWRAVLARVPLQTDCLYTF